MELSAQYDALAAEYRQAVTDYAYASAHGTLDDWAVAPNMALSPSTDASGTPVNSADQCRALCAANAQCKGATFFETSGQCTVYTTAALEAPVSLAHASAVVPNGQRLLLRIDQLNRQLVAMNDALRQQYARQDPGPGKRNREDRARELSEQYAHLVSEQTDIERLVARQRTVAASRQDMTLRADHAYAWHHVMVGVVGILLIVFLRVAVFVPPPDPTASFKFDLASIALTLGALVASIVVVRTYL